MGKSFEDTGVSLKIDTSRLQSGKPYPVKGIVFITVPADFGIAESKVVVKLDACVQKTRNDYRFFGGAKCDFSAKCSGCLTDLRDTVEFDISEIFSENPDVDEFPAGSEIDLSEAVEMILFLNIPSAFWCTADCKGLCPICGINLNESSCDCDSQKSNGLFDGLLN